MNKYGFTVIDTNRYGLSPVLVGRIIQAKAFFDHIEFYHNCQQHIGTLLKKPGAVEHIRLFQQIPKL